MADQDAHKIVGLIEHAELCQEAATVAQKAMNATVVKLAKESQALDARIAATVVRATKASFRVTAATIRDDVTRSIDEPIKTLQRASVDLDRVVTRLSWRVVTMASVVTFAMVLAPLAVWWLLIPSASELSALRAERESLVADVNRLKLAQRVTACGPRKLPCIRVQLKGGTYGDTGDYLLLHAE